jgi:hypothetical protein
MATIVRSRAVLLLAQELGLVEHLDAEVLEAFAVSASGPRDLILFSIARSLNNGSLRRLAGKTQQGNAAP